MFTILAIAGSDSCAGAGIQIDMKTAAAHGVHATCAITAITAQNTREVTAVQMTQPDVLRAQIDAVFADMPPAAVKIGMLGTAEVAASVAEALEAHPEVPVVLDPVLVATAGAELTSAAAFDVLRGRLVPRATVVTPNLPEAAALTGQDTGTPDGVRAAAEAFLRMGAGAVLVKGGHGNDEVIRDCLYVAARMAGGAPAEGQGCEQGADGAYVFEANRLPGEYHGTGCSLSTAIACGLARGDSVVQAVRSAHAYLSEALRYQTGLGQGTNVFNPLGRLDRTF